MTSPTESADIVAFAEKLFVLLHEGKKVATYKYAVLLGLIDLCLERSMPEGGAPQSITTEDLAWKVTALYWPQAIGFEGKGVLHQSTRGANKVVRLIEEFRAGLGGASFGSVSVRRNGELIDLVAQVERKLVEDPIPRLQIAGGNERFIYEINWDQHHVPRIGEGFDNQIRFKEGVAEHLVRLAPLLRPLIRKEWTSMVSRLNGLQNAKLEEHLFERKRILLAPVMDFLRELQRNRCLYCGAELPRGAEVDHFIPWSRHPDDGLDNLVIAHRECNNDKRNFLASARHAASWKERNVRGAVSLLSASDALDWERAPIITFETARGMYLRLTDSVHLWDALPKTFVPPDRPLLHEIFRSPP